MSQASSSSQPTSLLLASLIRLSKGLLHQSRRLDPLSFSSQQCASWRAMETNLSDPLVRDPYAETLAGPVAMSRARKRGQPRYPRFSVRTRYFDDFTSKSLAQRSQVVLLGAGMDMRAYRLSAVTEKTNLFEIDVASVINLKEHLLNSMRPRPTPRGVLTRLRADVTSDWADKLCVAGFLQEEKTVWLMEGLIYYLEQEQVDKLLTQIFELSAPGSVIYFSAVARLKRGVNGLASMFKSCMPDPEGYLGKMGFRTQNIAQLGGPDANYGRWPVDETGLVQGTTIYVTAIRP